MPSVKVNFIYALVSLAYSLNTHKVDSSRQRKKCKKTFTSYKIHKEAAAATVKSSKSLSSLSVCFFILFRSTSNDPKKKFVSQHEALIQAHCDHAHMHTQKVRKTLRNSLRIGEIFFPQPELHFCAHFQDFLNGGELRREVTDTKGLSGLSTGK